MTLAGEVVVLLKVSLDLLSWLQECVVPENPKNQVNPEYLKPENPMKDRL